MLAAVRLPKCAFLACALLLASAAGAQTYANTNDGALYTFGAGSSETSNLGEVFTTGGGVLSSWTSWATAGVAGNVDLVIAQWNGITALGPVLNSPSSIAYAGGAQALSFNGINAQLAAGTYIAYLSVSGVPNAATGITLEGSNTQGGIGAGLRYLNSGSVDPLTGAFPWSRSTFAVTDLRFSATFGSPAPEPQTIGLLALGLCAAGLASIRGRRGATLRGTPK